MHEVGSAVVLKHSLIAISAVKIPAAVVGFALDLLNQPINVVFDHSALVLIKLFYFRILDSGRLHV
jgi:hypothetical protein